VLSTQQWQWRDVALVAWCDVMGAVNVAMVVEGCAVSGMEVCDVEGFAMVPLGVYSSLELELS